MSPSVASVPTPAPSHRPRAAGAPAASAPLVRKRRYMLTPMQAVMEVARKEVLQALRTKRLLGIGIAFTVVMLLLTVVVPLAVLRGEVAQALGDQVDADVPLEHLVLMFFLSGIFILSGYFYIQLLPLLMSADAVSSEWSHRTIFLLLSKPVGRASFVLGKFLGTAVTVATTIATLLLLDYLLLQMLFPGHPSGEAVLGFLGALGLILLGTVSFVALGLLCSTLTRSTIAGMLVAVTSWIIVLPLLGNLGRIVALARHGFSAFEIPATSGEIAWSAYLSPSDCMRVASALLVGEDFGQVPFFGGAAAIPAAGAALALVAQTAVFLALALWIVQRRNFE